MLKLATFIVWFVELPIRSLGKLFRHHKKTPEEIKLKEAFNERMIPKVIYASWVASLKGKKGYEVALTREDVLSITTKEYRLQLLLRAKEAGIEIPEEILKEWC